MIIELLLAQAMSTGQVRAQMVSETNRPTSFTASLDGVVQIDPEGLLFKGVRLAQISMGDVIAGTHCSSLLEKAGIESAGWDSPYRHSFESSGPSFLVVHRTDLARARKVLSNYAGEGYVVLSEEQQSAVPVGYKSVKLSQLAAADFTITSDGVLARCLSSFVEEIIPRRPIKVLSLAIRQRKYFASAKDTKLSVGYDVLVIAREQASSDSIVYHSQSLASNQLTPWQRPK